MLRESIYKNYIPAVSGEPDSGGKAFWFIFSSNKLLLTLNSNKAGIPFVNGLKDLNLQPVRTQYLGTLQGNPCCAAELEPGTAAPAGMSFNDLRSVYDFMDEDLFLLAGKAVQVIGWDQDHQYCGRCGKKTENLEGERAKKCPSCGLVSYPRLSPAIITAVVRDKKILLSHYAAFPGKWYTIVAGFVEPGETLEECVKREVFEETGIKVKNIRYFGSQPWPFPHSLMIGFIAEYESGEIKVDGKEISAAGWFEAGNIPEVPPKISISREIIDWFVENYSG
ncbi:MAG: NAD(+) diphosphatase [Dehalococcoidales bacterium]|nr:NAD(+) diphosphatase [Dehalococcoidales bacterium]